MLPKWRMPCKNPAICDQGFIMKLNKSMMGSLLLAGSSALSACTGQPSKLPTAAIPDKGITSWHEHFDYGRELLADSHAAKAKAAFARAAFESAARFSRDYAPAYAGLGYANMLLGDWGQAQRAYLKAGMLADDQFYWALGAMAALKSGDELAAFTFYQQMEKAEHHSDDDVSNFIRSVYGKSDMAHAAKLQVISHANPSTVEDKELVCDEKSDKKECKNLNITAEVFFIRRTSSHSMTVGNDFFSDLVFQLGAQRVISAEKEVPNDWDTTVSDEINLSIPDIRYAVRALPLMDDSNVYVNATPSVLMTLGNSSEVREGSDKTIFYNSSVFSDNYTAKTGTTLTIEPEKATNSYCRMKIEFEFSSLNSLTPGSNALVLDVTTSNYDLTGYFPYDTPVVLGTVSSGKQEESSGGQKGLQFVPVIGNVAGSAGSSLSKADTLVLGRVSAPAAFAGSSETQTLETMRQSGIKVDDKAVIKRRKIIYSAPDLHKVMQDFMAEQN